VACEVICRKMFIGLRGTILSQSKSFLSSFHAQRLSQCAKLVEEELWAPAEVTCHFQDIAKAIVDGAVQDPPSWKLEETGGTTINGVPSSPNGSAKPAETLFKFLQIEDRTYYAVGATLHVLSLTVDYLKVIVNLPILTLDIMSRMVELLKSFNSRTCQVVLGAGAMRSAGLKNITAKHLGKYFFSAIDLNDLLRRTFTALASQSLSIMTALVPYIGETFRRHLNSKQAVMLIEFDKLKRVRIPPMNTLSYHISS
jgi:vacuolar protein sorting-associated protein 54